MAFKWILGYENGVRGGKSGRKGDQKENFKNWSISNHVENQKAVLVAW